MKNTKDLSYLKLSVKQQKALKQRREDNARKSAEFLAARKARREASNGPLEGSLSPKSKLLVIKNTGTNYSFSTFDHPHAVQLREFVNSAAYTALLAGMSQELTVVADVDEDDQE